MAKQKLTQQQQERIFELNQVDGFSQKKLANLYDVSQPTISVIIERQQAKHEKERLENTIAEAAARGYKAAFSEQQAVREIEEAYLEDSANTGFFSR